MKDERKEGALEKCLNDLEEDIASRGRSDSSSRRTTNNFLHRHRHFECLPRSSIEASAPT